VYSGQAIASLSRRLLPSELSHFFNGDCVGYLRIARLSHPSIRPSVRPCTSATPRISVKSAAARPFHNWQAVLRRKALKFFAVLAKGVYVHSIIATFQNWPTNTVPRRTGSRMGQMYVCLQSPMSQESSVHWLPSSQFLGLTKQPWDGSHTASSHLQQERKCCKSEANNLVLARIRLK
jgi:hypothetical protein